MVEYSGREMPVLRIRKIPDALICRMLGQIPHEFSLFLFWKIRNANETASVLVMTISWAKIIRGVSKSFRTGRLERELQMVQLSATMCSCITILWVSVVSFAAINLCVASQLVFIFVVYFVIDSVREILDTSSYSWLISEWSAFTKCLLPLS
jgi:hypothetical protein